MPFLSERKKKQENKKTSPGKYTWQGRKKVILIGSSNPDRIPLLPPAP